MRTMRRIAATDWGTRRISLTALNMGGFPADARGVSKSAVTFERWKCETPFPRPRVGLHFNLMVMPCKPLLLSRARVLFISCLPRYGPARTRW